MNNYKTTIAGVLAIVAAVSGAAASYFGGHPVDFASVSAAVMAGVGLIASADAKKTDPPK